MKILLVKLLNLKFCRVSSTELLNSPNSPELGKWTYQRLSAIAETAPKHGCGIFPRCFTINCFQANLR